MSAVMFCGSGQTMLIYGMFHTSSDSYVNYYIISDLYVNIGHFDTGTKKNASHTPEKTFGI